MAVLRLGALHRGLHRVRPAAVLSAILAGGVLRVLGPQLQEQQHHRAGARTGGHRHDLAEDAHHRHFHRGGQQLQPLVHALLRHFTGVRVAVSVAPLSAVLHAVGEPSLGRVRRYFPVGWTVRRTSATSERPSGWRGGLRVLHWGGHVSVRWVCAGIAPVGLVRTRGGPARGQCVPAHTLGRGAACAVPNEGFHGGGGRPCASWRRGGGCTDSETGTQGPSWGQSTRRTDRLQPRRRRGWRPGWKCSRIPQR